MEEDPREIILEVEEAIARSHQAPRRSVGTGSLLTAEISTGGILMARGLVEGHHSPNQAIDEMTAAAAAATEGDTAVTLLTDTGGEASMVVTHT